MEHRRIVPPVRVELIDEAVATGRTAELYEDIRTATGLPFVPDVFRLISTRPDLLHAVVAGYKAIYDGGVLPRDTKELISAWTSKVNDCPYCVGAHSWFLQQFGGTAELAAAIAPAASPEDLPVDEPTRALLRMATKVTAAANRITDADWDTAVAAGWSDAELLEAVFCAALFNFINRLVDALGLGAQAR
jgi:uncharacterized peroxidase-related enzyme